MRPFLLHLLIVVFITIGHLVCGQSIPKNPNQLANGQRQGKWTLMFDKDWNEITEPSKAAYYRLIEYNQGKPTGIARDYFANGKLQWEGQLLGENPDVNSGTCIWYNEDGTKQREANYVNGKLEGKEILYFQGKKLAEGTNTNDKKNLDWIYYGTDYNSLSATATQYYHLKDHANAEAAFKKALDLAVKSYGTSSVQYRDTRWWMYFLYDDTGRVPDAVAALADAARASASLHDEFEIRVIEDAERYADKLKADKNYDPAISLYRLASRTRELRGWLADASYYKDLKSILDISYWMDRLDSMQYYFEKIASILPSGQRQLATHLYDWASYTVGQKQQAYFGKIEKACEDFLKNKEQKNEKDPGSAETWIAYGKIQHAKGQYERALRSFADARAALEAEKQQILYMRALSLSAASYNASKKYDATAKAVFDEFEIWNDRFATYLGTTYIGNLTDVVRYATNTKDYARAEKALLKSMPVAEKEFGRNSPEYKGLSVTLASVYEAQGKNDLAKSVMPTMSADDQRKIAESMGAGEAANNLALLQKAVEGGRFSDAVAIFEKSFPLIKSYYESTGNYDGLVFVSCAVASSYQQTGDLYKAGQLLLNTRKVADEYLEKSSDTYIFFLLTLGDYYAETGAFKEADQTFYSGMQILDKSKTPANAAKNDEKYYEFTERMALLFARRGYFRDAEVLYSDVLAYQEKTNGRNSLRYHFAAMALGDLYQRMRLFALASDLYGEAMPVLKKELGEQSPAYIDAARTLANIHLLQGNYAQAEGPYLRAKSFYQGALGTRSDRYLGVLADLGLLYTYSGQWSKAAPVYHEQIALQLEQVKNLFPLMSEKEKTAFYSLTRSKFNTYNVFAMNQLKASPAEAGEMYNLQLVSKSLLLKATNRVRTSVLNSNDESLKSLYSHWQSSREQLAKVYQLSEERKQAAGVDEKQLEKRVNELERELTIKSELFARLISDNPDWKAVRNALKPGEAAVEIVRIVEALPEFTFDYIGKGITVDTLDREGYARVNNLAVKCAAVKAGLQVGETILSINDQSTKGKSIEHIVSMLKTNPVVTLVLRKKHSKVSYTAQIRSDSVFYRSYPKKVRYVALAVTPDAQSPRYVTIENGDDLETKYAKFYRNAMQLRLEDPHSYKIFWQPVQEILGAATKRVYFSPDGVYNTINPATLHNPGTKRFVLDDTELVLVSNTADILRPATPSPSRKAVLFGFPDYTGASTPAGTEPSEFMLLKNDSARRFFTGDNITELPGTRVEVNAIESLLKPGMEVMKYMSAEASEEKIKEIAAPKLVHIATHGFFLDDISENTRDGRSVTGIASATLAENPLLRSGLLLAGAGKTITEGRRNSQSEDGVLTAYEALNLNLHQTDMVVLSACETGLGQIQTGEGVYGLQRAFRAAGAQSVLMSLWKVDDEATQQLMTGFYAEWLATGNRQTAFRQAQLKLRNQFSHPYFWGAFVMMGH
ncbi:MAG TPA: CHAT domain-containing protein [Chryseosolibacter sp.]|nr:CHAT domain-containing protein [Chryseosolibacter sp.]